MDKLKLKKYRPNKARLKRINTRIEELCGKEVDIVMGKVTGSSRDFPYTEVRTSVQMYDPEENDRINEQIRKKEIERLEVLAEIQEVEEFFSKIDDGETKEIFELVYQQGLNQTEAGERIGYSQGRVSQKIGQCIEKINSINNLDML